MQMAQRTTSVSQTQSVNLVKNLFRAAFSSIAYVRDLFDDDCFDEGVIGGTKYQKIVKGDNKEVQQFADWLELGVFDALHRKYLEVVLLEIYDNPKNPSGKTRASRTADRATQQKLLECYSFNVSYGADGATFDLATRNGKTGDTSTPMESRANIKQSLSEVIQLLIELTGTLAPLPARRIVSMKLMYTPGTPIEYEPPLFEKAKPEDMYWFEERPIRMCAGSVTTPFHQVSMSVRSTKDRCHKGIGGRSQKEPAQHIEDGRAVPEKDVVEKPTVAEVCSDDSTVTASKAPHVVDEEGNREVLEIQAEQELAHPAPQNRQTKVKNVKSTKSMKAKKNGADPKATPTTPNSVRNGETRKAKTRKGSSAKRPRVGGGNVDSVWNGTKRTRRVSQARQRLTGK